MAEEVVCVAKPSSDQATLLANVNYACFELDCKILLKGCPCFYPDNLINRASIATNLYFLPMELRVRDEDSGLVVVSDLNDVLGAVCCFAGCILCFRSSFDHCYDLNDIVVEIDFCLSHKQ